MLEARVQIEELLKEGQYSEAKAIVDRMELTEETHLLYAHLFSMTGDYNSRIEHAQFICNAQQATPGAKIEACNHMGWAKFRQGAYEEAEVIANRSAQLITTHGSVQEFNGFYTDMLNLKGAIYVEQGRLKESLEYYKEVVQLRRKKRSKKTDLAGSYNNIAFVYQKMGVLNKAKEYYFHALDVFEDIGHIEGMNVVKSNIAEIHRLKADLDQAHQLHKEVLDCRKELKNEYKLALSYQYVGLIEMERGNLENARRNFNESLKFWDSVGNAQWKSLTLLNYGKLKITLKEDITSLLEELELMVDKSSNQVIFHRYNLLKALDLKSKPRMSTIVQAQVLLEKIANDEVLDFEVTFDAIIELCDILFKELQISDDELIYHEIRDLIERVEILARNNNAYSKLIEVLFIKAKMAIVDLQYPKAEALLVQAELLSEEKQMQYLKERFQSVRRNLQMDMHKLNNILMNNSNVIERAKIVRLTEYMTEAYSIAASERDKMEES